MTAKWFYDPSAVKGHVLNRLDAVIYDLRFQLLPPKRPATVPIVIVDIDEASLQAEGRWPWSRTKVAQMVEQLQQQGAALIAFDVVFAESEINPVQQLLQQAELSPSTTDEITSLLPAFDADQQLSQALGFNTVLGYFFHADGYSSGYLPPPLLELEPEAETNRPLLLREMPHYTANLEDLGQMALQLSLVITLAFMNLVGGYLIITRQKHAIQQLFGEYVPAEHVEYIINHPDTLFLEGEQREMTVLFADIRQFTVMSENLSAAELKQVLNRYLSAITEVIFQHNGTIDKYVGDMVMAFWNAPLDEPNHASLAVQAALAMQHRMKQLRAEFEAEQLPAFHIGIGLNTGLMNVGDMGSTYRRAYTVLGDAVNLASRLESLTAYYQVPILVSDSTCAKASSFIYRTIDKVRVKGRQQSLCISQPFDKNDLNEQKKQELMMYQQALDSYWLQQWEQALSDFQQLHSQHPQEAIYRLYIERIVQYRSAGIDTDWDGVFDHEKK